MATDIEVFRQIEELLGTQERRELQKLLMSETNMSDSELHFLRGRAVMLKEFGHMLRSNLGYSPDGL